ncbi:MAG: hypothetical protein MZW92_17875 [Comamonadaceae bacterium]|nr:hypothetical protein [Comamonadaceae bacterium]
MRFPAEYAFDKIPGAIVSGLNEIRNATGSLDPAAEYITYCQSGKRSSAAAFSSPSALPRLRAGRRAALGRGAAAPG